MLTLVKLSDYERRYEELRAYERELDCLPADIETIIELEEMGWRVDLATGDLTPDTGRVSLTVLGEMVTIADQAWWEGEASQP